MGIGNIIAQICQENLETTGPLFFEWVGGICDSKFIHVLSFRGPAPFWTGKLHLSAWKGLLFLQPWPWNVVNSCVGGRFWEAQSVSCDERV